MSDWLFWLLLTTGLLAAGFLLVRHDVIDPQDAVAGGALIAVAAAMWRWLTRSNDDEKNGAQHPLAPDEPEPITAPDDLDEILDETDIPDDSGSADVSSDDPADWTF